ncbi:hypothetical protein, partial [Marinobacterium alkalitolerans]|uniref:hypothetical protein n=1 Tax=Marinobacterium alkalitolerans TaxID=1542925 RepID=UPI001ADD9F5E
MKAVEELETIKKLVKDSPVEPVQSNDFYHSAIKDYEHQISWVRKILSPHIKDVESLTLREIATLYKKHHEGVT